VKIGLGQRTYHQTSKLRCLPNGSSSDASKDAPTATGSVKFDLGAKKTNNTAKKESFDEFFENLMKGQSGGAKPTPTAGPAGTGGINLEAILSSLSKPTSEGPTAEQQEEVDARFVSIFKKRTARADPATESPSENSYIESTQNRLEKDEDEFAEFLQALKKDYKSPKAEQTKSVEFPSIVRPFKPKLQDIPGEELGKYKGEAAVSFLVEKMKEWNPEHVKAAEEKLNLSVPIVSRSKLEEQMSATDTKERMELNHAHKEIRDSSSLPIYVTGARVPNAATGGHDHVDLLAAYEDSDMAQMARLALDQEAEQSQISDKQVAEALRLTEAEALEDHPLTSEKVQALFEELGDSSKRIEDMQYWALFPTAVKRWLIYTRTPKGFYNDSGQWETIPQNDPELFLASEAKAMGMSPSELRVLGQSEEEIEEALAAEDEYAAQSARGRRGDEAMDEMEEMEEGMEEMEEGIEDMEEGMEELEEGLEEIEGELGAGATEREDEMFDNEELGLVDDDAEASMAEAEERLAKLQDLQGSQLSRLEALRIRAAKDLAEGLQNSEAEAERRALGDDNEPSPAHTTADMVATNIMRTLDDDWHYWEGVYNHEQQYLPADLQGQFRFHIRPEEIDKMHPRLKRHFSFKFASESEITKFRSHQHVRKWGKHPGDTGNSAVQIAILTLRINHLSKVLRTNVTDSHNGYRLQLLVKRRKALMKHLKKNDLMTYYSLLKDIKLRDQVELWTSMRK
jgi:small subunit ribosomal protein S15